MRSSPDIFSRMTTSSRLDMCREGESYQRMTCCAQPTAHPRGKTPQESLRGSRLPLVNAKRHRKLTSPKLRENLPNSPTPTPISQRHLYLNVLALLADSANILNQAHLYISVLALFQAPFSDRFCRARLCLARVA